MLGWIPQFFSFFIRSESEGEILSDWGDKIFFPNHKLWFIWRLPNWSEILTSEKNSASFITSHLPCLILQYPGTTEPCEPKPVLVMSRRQAHSVFRWASYRTDLVFPFFTAPTHTMVTHNVCVCVCVFKHTMVNPVVFLFCFYDNYRKIVTLSLTHKISRRSWLRMSTWKVSIWKHECMKDEHVKGEHMKGDITTSAFGCSATELLGTITPPCAHISPAGWCRVFLGTIS